MKIALSQIKPITGNVDYNIALHKTLINQALLYKADAIFFPELSITGYEPELAKELATHLNDERFDDFEKISIDKNITIGVGMPTICKQGINISLLIFQPNIARQIYAKQKLHEDELPYFVTGEQELILNIQNNKIAPAICYESLQDEHAEAANKLGADIYLASVAKPQNGIYKTLVHYPKIAKKYSMPVLMSNCIGYCDNFLSVGSSAIWAKSGNLLGQLNTTDQGLLIFDTETENVITEYL